MNIQISKNKTRETGEIKKIKKIRRKSIISSSTWYTIIVLVTLFLVWNYYLMPKMFTIEKAQPIAEIPKIRRGDVDFVNKQIKNRAIKIPPTKAPSSDIGKQNPFEE